MLLKCAVLPFLFMGRVSSNKLLTTRGWGGGWVFTEHIDTYTCNIESQHGTWIYNVASLPTLKWHGSKAVWYVMGFWALTKPGATLDVIGFNINIVDVGCGIWQLLHNRARAVP